MAGTESGNGGSGDDPLDDFRVDAQLAALQLVRLAITDGSTDDQLTLVTTDGPGGKRTIDVDVVQELVNLSGDLVNAIAELTGRPTTVLIDERTKMIVGFYADRKRRP